MIQVPFAERAAPKGGRKRRVISVDSEAQVGHPFQPGPEHTEKGLGGQTAVVWTCARRQRWRLVEEVLPRGVEGKRQRWMLTQQTIDQKVTLAIAETRAETKEEAVKAAVNAAVAAARLEIASNIGTLIPEIIDWTKKI